MRKDSIENYLTYDDDVEELFRQDMHDVLIDVLQNVSEILYGTRDRTATETYIEDLCDLTNEIYEKGGWVDNFEMTDSLYRLIGSLRQFNVQRAPKYKRIIYKLRKLWS